MNITPFSFLQRTLIPLCLLTLSACAVGPDYQRPAALDSAENDTFQSAPEHWGTWYPAQPGTIDTQTRWWSIFSDKTLDTLIEKVNLSNQTILAAEANYRKAQAAIQSSRAAYYPQIDAQANITRSTTASSSQPSTMQNLSVSASWELDLWGAIRRQVENSTAAAEASQADLAALRLSTQSTLAQTYFLLRVTDEQKNILERTVDDYTEFLRLVQNQYTAGIAQRADVLQAQTQLKTAQAQLINTEITRKQYENALANLTGTIPSAFSLPVSSLNLGTANLLSQLPPALPSQLLERRPDIAAAERRMAAANAEIGIAQAAYYPHLTLSASRGFSGEAPTNWLALPNPVWSLGPALASTLFDGGARSAARLSASAAYDASVATYRQTVLNAFQEVEDNLAALQLLAREAVVQYEALHSAREALALINNRYRAGTASLLDVLTAQTTAQSAELNTLTLIGRQFTTSITLVTALGGGWDAQKGVNLSMDSAQTDNIE